MASTTGTVTDSSTAVVLTKASTENLVSVQVYGTYTGVTFTLDGSVDGTNYLPLVATKLSDGSSINGTITPGSNASVAYEVVAPNFTYFRLKPTGYSTGTMSLSMQAVANVAPPVRGSVVSGGTFSSVTLSGTTTAALTNFSVMPTIPCATVAGAGSTQGDAAAIATGFTLVTLADDTVGVKLPTASAGLVCIVKSSVANKILKVYPNTSDGINALSVNAAISLASGPTIAMFVAYDATTWYTLPLLPS